MRGNPRVEHAIADALPTVLAWAPAHPAGEAAILALMPESSIVDNAIVDALNTLLEGARDVHIVGALSDAAQERLTRNLGRRLAAATRSDPGSSRHETVVVLDAQRLGDAQAMVNPEGMLTVAAVNPRYGSLLVAVLEGRRAPGSEAVDLDAVCGRLERDGWEVGNATPVAVPLALIPFDPARIPKTVLAYLYARHPEIETYCFLVPARRPVAGPPRRRAHAPPPSAEFPTLPWKSESEWREEARQCAARLAGRPPCPEIAAVARVEEVARRAPQDTGHMFEALRLELRRSDEELFHIKSSLTWRAIVKYRTWRERLLPPRSRRGRLYERARSAIRRLVLGDR